MPRRAGLSLPGVPLHPVQRGNNRQACFFAPDDRQHDLDWLEDRSLRQGCSVLAYVPVHLLVSAVDSGGNNKGQTTFSQPQAVG